MAYCKNCGKYFHREDHEYWKKLCIECWREEKFGPAPKTGISRVLENWISPKPAGLSPAEQRLQSAEADNARLRYEHNHLRQRHIDLQKEVYELQAQLYKEKVLAHAFKPSSGSDSFISKHIKDFLMLCHPDRHQNSDKATEITSWLIDFKKRMQGDW